MTFTDIRLGSRPVTSVYLGSTLLWSPSAQQASGVPAWDHVVIVIMENHSQTGIIGNSSAPYITALANNNVNFTQSYGITHPSQPNYLAFFSGSTQGVTDDGPCGPFSGANLAQQLIAAGKTFIGYSEDLPSVGYTGNSSGGYVKKHNPWSDFTNVSSTLNQPFSAFPSTYSQLPTVSIVVPNMTNDMHDGTISQGDVWLQNHLDGYLTWAKTHNSLLIVTFDEDDYNSSNRIPTVMAGAHQVAGSYSQTIDHYSVLGMLQDAYGLSRIAGSVGKAAINSPWA